MTTPLRGLLLLGLLLLLALVVVPAPPVHARQLPGVYGYPGGVEFSYSRGGFGRGFRLNGGFVTGGLIGFPPPGPCPFPIWCPPPIRRVTIIAVAPPPPVVVLAPQFVQPPVEDPVPPVPVVPIPEVPPPQKEAPKKEKPPPELPLPPEPKADPAEEHDRQVVLGEEAFRQQEYGLAAQRFRQATRLRPAEGRSYFLLAQALIAQGKYHDARDAVVAGLERKPDWPTAGIRPLGLYDAVAEYAEQLRTLEAALGRHPNDPVLLFVGGYALWFDGRRDEAGRLFTRALARGVERKEIEPFLSALPAGETL